MKEMQISKVKFNFLYARLGKFLNDDNIQH